MKTDLFAELIIRSAVVRGPDIGNILACDLEKEEEDAPHAYVFKWQAGSFIKSLANFDAHTVCFIKSPEPALIFLAEAGEFGVHHKGGSQAGDIFQNSQPPPKKPRLGGVRSVSEIAGKAYAVGFRGMVYRLDDFKTWTRIDDGLPESFEIEAAHGFEASDIYAVGDDGELWHYNGRKWTYRELPTNVNLNTIKCADNGKVYVAGDDGTLIGGRAEVWEVIDRTKIEDDIWDLEWFEEKLYVSTMDNIYCLEGDELVPVNFGKDSPSSCYQLSAAKGVMWSNGEHDIMSFDGKKWTRIV